MREVTLLNIATVKDPTVAAALQEIQTASRQNNLGPIANNTIIGNVSGGKAQPAALTQSQLTSLISPFSASASGAVPASGKAGASQFLNGKGQFSTPAQPGIFAGGPPGLVPQSDGDTINFLRADGQFATPPSTGGTTTAPFTFVNILRFNADPTGNTDNTAALAAAFAALGPTGGTIYFPQGKYLFNSQQNINLPQSGQNAQGVATTGIFDLTILGDGSDATILFWPNSNGLTVGLHNVSTFSNVQSFHARDLSFTTGALPSTVFYALSVSQFGSNNGANAALTELTRVTFRGDDGMGGTFGWGIGFNCIGVSNIDVVGCLFQGPNAIGGIGIQLAGLSVAPLDIAVVHNVQACTFNLLTFGFQLANAFAQGVTFNQCNFTGCTNGINIPQFATLVSGTAIAQLCVVSCQFGTFTPGPSNGIAANPASPIAILLVSNSLFLLGGSGAGIVAPFSNSCITGNTFQASSPTGTTGLQVTANPSNTCNTIVGNNFINLGSGITLQAGANNNNIGPNAFLVCTTNIINGSAAANRNVGEWFHSQAAGFAVNMGNIGGAAGDHGIAVFAGASGATDSSTIMVDFLSSGGTAVGSITRAGSGVSYNTSSDSRLKVDIGPTTRGLADLLRIPVAEFAWRADPERKRVQGFIAQTLLPHCPDAVRVGGDDPSREPWTVDYSRVTPMLTRAVQELAGRVEELERRGLP